MGYLNKKFVIVTGATSGIGLELSKQIILKYNGTVLGIGRQEQKLNSAHQLLGENFIPFKMDVSIESEWQRLADFIKANNYAPNIMANNAGIMQPFLPATKISLEDYKAIINTNLMSVLYSLNYIVPILSGDKGVVNISSSASLCPVVGQSGYTLTKCAIKGLTEVISAENNIYSLLVMPGFCKTEITRSININDKEKRLIDKVSTSRSKCAKIIAKSINKKRHRKVIGFDAKMMNLLYKLFPKSAGKIIAWVLKKSKLKIFEDLN